MCGNQIYTELRIVKQLEVDANEFQESERRTYRSNEMKALRVTDEWQRHNGWNWQGAGGEESGTVASGLPGYLMSMNIIDNELYKFLLSSTLYVKSIS